MIFTRKGKNISARDNTPGDEEKIETCPQMNIGKSNSLFSDGMELLIENKT